MRIAYYVLRKFTFVHTREFYTLANFTRRAVPLKRDYADYHGLSRSPGRFIYFGNNCTGHYGVINCCGVNVLPITGWRRQGGSDDGEEGECPKTGERRFRMSINMSNPLPAQSSAFLACIREMKGERERWIASARGSEEGREEEQERERRRAEGGN